MTVPSIFLVDDDPAVRKAVRRLLLSLRHPVHQFSSAEEFLERLDANARGCLVLDVRLPGMSGLQLQETLRERKSPLVILFITAHDDADSRDMALRRGAVDYLRKPFARDELLARVRTALGRD
jgi:FixJ family two-component response regulator